MHHIFFRLSGCNICCHKSFTSLGVSELAATPRLSHGLWSCETYWINNNIATLCKPMKWATHAEHNPDVSFSLYVFICWVSHNLFQVFLGSDSTLKFCFRVDFFPSNISLIHQFNGTGVFIFNSFIWLNSILIFFQLEACEVIFLLQAWMYHHH